MHIQTGEMSHKEKSENLKDMVISFRIAELHRLLLACGLSRCGRKYELLGRALGLLEAFEGSSMRESIKTIILELYHQRCISSSDIHISLKGKNINVLHLTVIVILCLLEYVITYLNKVYSLKEHEPIFCYGLNNSKILIFLLVFRVKGAKGCGS